MEYKLKYQGTFRIPEAEGACVITLTDETETRAFSVITDDPTGMDIKAHEENNKAAFRNRAVDVLCSILLRNVPTLYRIRLEGIIDKGFRAFLVDTETGEEMPLRPDEAVLISMITGFELYTTLESLQKFSTPYNRNVMTVALPVLSLPNSLLKRALEKAISEENYESASFIRDEIKRREEHKKSMDKPE